VEICKHPSAEELERFPKAVRVLWLIPYISQKQNPTLRLGSPDTNIHSETLHGSKGLDTSRVTTKAGGCDGKDDAEELFPRLTLLTRHFA
jgi:hypothetical protein